MKKSLVLLAGASLAFLGLPAVTNAQAASGPFADVPTDHWAYASVDTLQKAGIVIGYPDGTYGGRRPMTRYEFAVAIARLLAQMPHPTAPGVSASDLAALRSDLENRIAGNTQAIDALRTLVNGFQPELTRLGQDVAAANARLDALSARVDALNNRLTNDEGILGSVVDEQRRIKITGEVNVVAEGDASRRFVSGAGGVGNLPFMDKNGNVVGNNLTNNYPGSGGSAAITRRHAPLLASTSVYHDILLHIRGKLSDTATANVDLDFGNYLSNVGNTAAFGGYPVNGTFGNSLTPGNLSAADQYTNVYKAYLDAAVKLGPLGGAELLVGRFGNQYTKYTLMQADADIYTNLPQTDSGDIIGDGGAVNFKLGPAKIGAFAAKFDQTPYSQPYAGSVNIGGGQNRPGGLINQNHGLAINDGAGIRATIGAPEGAVLGLTVEQFGLDNPYAPTGVPGATIFDGANDPNKPAGGANSQFNRLSVYGADFNGALPFGLPGIKKGGVLIDGAYTVSAHGINSGFNNIGKDFRYHSFDANAGVALGGLNLKGGYQYVGPEFSAPGYWGKIGAWTNPTNVRGPVVSAKYAFTPKLSLNADAEFYEAVYARNETGTPINSPLVGRVNGAGADRLNRYQVGLGYGLSSSYGVDLGYENVKYDLRNGLGTPTTGLNGAGKPEESYITLGLGHSFSSNASLKLLYQIVHYDDKGTGFGSSGISAVGDNKQDGSVVATQFQLKF